MLKSVSGDGQQETVLLLVDFIEKESPDFPVVSRIERVRLAVIGPEGTCEVARSRWNAKNHRSKRNTQHVHKLPYRRGFDLDIFERECVETGRCRSHFTFEGCEIYRVSLVEGLLRREELTPAEFKNRALELLRAHWELSAA